MTRFTLLPCALLFVSAVSPLHALLAEQGAAQSQRAVRSDGSTSSSTSTSRSSTSSTQEEDAAYAAGSRALEQQQWPEAVASFDKVINAKGKRADAALYWKAYTLNKLGKGPLALATCNQLRSQYASSPWNTDCRAVSIPLRRDFDVDVELPEPPSLPMPPMPDMDGERRHGRDAVQRGSDDDLKLLALNSLLNQDPAKAIPVLRAMLSGNQSMRVKKHALFVLAQSRSPEAQSVLHDAVLGKMDPELQREAIQSMAVFQGKRANDTLAEVYRSTSDASVRKSIISAFFISGDAPRMVELARNEKDLNVKRNIVSQLALMHDKAATDYMMELLK
ncbi:HEAT repeat domain-containing protein [Granulicella sp. dw_53]|uniref:HEAT repeat domain-containing protein n=1 Tax=Granulicella sp. dw_53 TaxID=2719792 RepID=UPI001BD20DCB|nr:HEAT repeat domain-containing protein [Granulicella sp. dw_53]